MIHPTIILLSIATPANKILNATVSVRALTEHFRHFIKLTHFLSSSLNQGLSKVIVACVYEAIYASIIDKIYELFNGRTIPQISECPAPFIFEQRRVGRNNSATNVSAREVGSRHKKKGIRDKNNGLRKQFQTSQTIFFRSPNVPIEIFV